MKLPRFSLRTLFIAVTAIAVVLGWILLQLDWIRRRHVWSIEGGAGTGTQYFDKDVQAPGLLWLFGEQGARDFGVPYTEKQAEDPTFDLWSIPHIKEGLRLFPEAKFSPYCCDADIQKDFPLSGKRQK